MPVIEMNEQPEMIGGSLFTPSANQAKFVSTWAIKEQGRGSSLPGFKSERELTQPQPFGHGSSQALAGFEPYKDDKNRQHVVNLNGTELVEMVCDRESMEKRDRWTGEVSAARVEGLEIKEIEKQRRAGLDAKILEERIIKT